MRSVLIQRVVMIFCVFSDATQVSQLVHHGFGGDGRYPEGLRVGLLKLGALLIEFMHTELLDHRKELIKFAWNNIKVLIDANRAAC